MIDQPKSKTSWQGQTLAYCPPEVLLRESPTGTMAADMWAIGVILYIMLTGIHPFDISGRATDDQVVALIKGKKTPPIRNTPITAHLSESAIDLIEKLMDPDPAQRMAAEQMLEHPWTRGLTARRDIMVDSDKRLSVYRNYKSGIAEKVFENIVTWSDEHDSDDLASRTSLIERAFRAFDPEQKGYLTQEDLKSVAPAGSENEQHKEHQYDSTLSLSDFSNLLSENIMKDRYFSKGTVVYREGQIGNSMYFINSGKVTVETKAGTCVQRGPGDFFGEGALFHPKKLRSVSITCETPVHAIEISREYFEKYVTPEKSELLLTLREKDKIRKRNRAKMTLKLQKTLAERIFSENDMVFQRGQPGDSIFIVKSGRVDVLENGKRVFTAKPDNVFGEFAVVTGRPRNSTAICADDECVIHELSGADFRALTKSHSEISTAIRDLCWRRDFKKAVVLQLQKEFPYDNPREAFDAIKRKDSGEDTLDFKAVANLMRRLNPECSDDEISEIIRVVDLTNTGYITFDEFKKVFIAHIRKSASV